MPLPFDSTQPYSRLWHKAQSGLINTQAEINALRFDKVPLPAPSLDPAAAEITLIRVPTPFVTEIRADERAALAKLRLSTIIWQIDLAKRFQRKPNIVFHDASNEVTICGERHRLPVVAYAQLRFLAVARREGWPGAGPDGYRGNAGWVTHETLTTQITRHFNPLATVLWPIVRAAVAVTGGETFLGHGRDTEKKDPLLVADAFKTNSQLILRSSGERDARAKLGKDVKSWFASLNGARQSLAGIFGQPVVNQLLPAPTRPTEQLRFSN